MTERPPLKPETMTCLYGSQLVEKDHPLIVFRGRVDTLAALILEAQILGEEKRNPAFVEDLQEILDFVRGIFPAEYRGLPRGEFRLLGLSGDEIRERSHHPERYFGRGHIPPDRSLGALSVRLNLLRTATRETELAAIPAFRDEGASGGCRRGDLVEALNRLSSLFYILMFKYTPE